MLGRLERGIGFSCHSNFELIDQSWTSLINNFSAFLNIGKAVKSIMHYRHGSVKFKPIMFPAGKLLPVFCPYPKFICLFPALHGLHLNAQSVRGRGCKNLALNQLKLLWNPALKGRSVIAAGSVVKQGEYWIFWGASKVYLCNNEFLLLWNSMPLNRYIFDYGFVSVNIVACFLGGERLLCLAEVKVYFLSCQPSVSGWLS